MCHTNKDVVQQVIWRATVIRAAYTDTPTLQMVTLTDITNLFPNTNALDASIVMRTLTSNIGGEAGVFQ